ncbi:stage V sporulation protein B [Metabacillus arenae]|uniref:Stage V sporulation protein B n=1 Tax=Metabacillus arenae TaxID=2771434 RepID=A0A926NBJ7_9BACI|nr:stage V sporulation protein B [Metabacillus arenae]MBD1381232.1 stage V sporulation protein B [Metabacillus arenae]
MSKQTFIKGTLTLIVAAFITKILGFINRLVLARYVGEEGVGLYMMAVPSLVLIITITQLGLPVAISKLVSEAEAQNDRRKIKKILVVSLAITGSLSILFTPAIIFLAPILAEIFFTDPRTLYPLLAISPVVPIIAISSVLRGYFQGKQNMKPAAYSQILEQVVRISLIAIFTQAFLPYGIEYAAAGAMASAVVGELISLLYLFAMFKLKKKVRIRKNFFKSIQNGKATMHELLAIALPTTGSRLIGSVAWFFEPIVVAQSLAIAGVATSLATKQYGALTGYAVTLLTLPSFITYSLSTSLVPAISEAMAQKKFRLVEYRLQQALRLSFVTGGLAVVILYIYASPLMEVLYGNNNSAIFVQIMAPFFIFYYLQGPLQASLQALNLARAAMINSFIGAVIKTGLIFILASRPSLGIMGAALAIVVGMMVVTLLHFATVLKVISFTIHIRQYTKCLITMALSGLIGYVFYKNLVFVDSPPLNLVICISFTTVSYCLFLIAFRLVEKEEIQRIPFIGSYLALLIPRKN